MYSKLGIASRKALCQWFRAPKSSVLRRTQNEIAMTNVLKLGPIGQISRTVRDIGEAERFLRPRPYA